MKKSNKALLHSIYIYTHLEANHLLVSSRLKQIEMTATVNGGHACQESSGYIQQRDFLRANLSDGIRILFR